MTAGVESVRCRYCGSKPGEPCHSWNRRVEAWDRVTKTHAIRWADFERGEPVEPDGDNVVDFEAARRRKLARANGYTGT